MRIWTGIIGIILAAALVVTTFVPIEMSINRDLLSIRLSQVGAQELEVGEIVESRDQYTKVYYLGDNKYALDTAIGSIHYKDNPDDPDELWKDIDTTIVASDRAAWDWEVVKGHWHVLIAADTAAAVGKDGHWIGFRYEGYGYLDWATKEHVILGTRQDVTPVVTNNTITWTGIFGAGTILEYIYTTDGFKENLYIEQSARDWQAAHPPSSYGLDNTTSYLVGFMEMDWRNAYPAETADGTPINWSNINEFIDSGVYWRHPVKDYLVTALPLDYARHADVESENWTALKYRFYEHTNGTHYLLFGAKVTDLNAYPDGTIAFDPTLDLQVGASADDAHEHTFSNSVSIDSGQVMHVSSDSTTGYVAGHRWVSGSFPAQGDTIDACYVEFYVWATAYDDMYGKWHFEKAAAPAQFTTTDGDITGRSRTTELTVWSANSLGTGWKQSPSFVTPFQEVIDSYSPTAVVAIFMHYDDLDKLFRPWGYDQSSSYGAKLHLEWSVPASPEITNAPDNYGFGVLPVNTTSTTGLDYFTITNTGNCAVDIVIYGTDLTGGDDTWDLADDATPGENIYALKAGLDGGDYTIIVRETETYNTLKSNLAISATQDWGLKLWLPTSVTGYDSQQMGGTVTLVASEAS